MMIFTNVVWNGEVPENTFIMVVSFRFYFLPRVLVQKRFVFFI